MDNNEKSLSNWLLASDIDGTINDKARRLVKRNYDAIHRYVDDFGGNFTLASGRSPDSMRKHFKRLDIAVGNFNIRHSGVLTHKLLNRHFSMLQLIRFLLLAV